MPVTGEAKFYLVGRFALHPAQRHFALLTGYLTSARCLTVTSLEGAYMHTEKISLSGNRLNGLMIEE
jgi:hypothetical protein